MQTERDTLLSAILRRVPFDGWTEATLRAAGEDAGLDALAQARLFPHGIGDCVDYFAEKGDAWLKEKAAALPLGTMKLAERIAALVMLRLSYYLPHREAVRRSVAFYALPPHAGAGLAALYRTVDTLWQLAGDRSLDFSFYTKRATLAGIYSATLLYWLNDESEEQVETCAFLDRRLGDVLRFAKFKARCRETMHPWLPAWLRAQSAPSGKRP